MRLGKQIPNYITLGNLFAGTVAAIFAVEGNFKTAAIFVLIGIILDFFDGFIARLLGVSGELGKQLDSLADMVTSGVVPGIIMFKLIQSNLNVGSNLELKTAQILDVPLIGLILTLAACYRLASFNLDTRQSDSFIGLPTPAMCLFVVSLPLIRMHSGIEFVNDLISNNYFLIAVTWILSFLMNAEMHLFSLKFKEYSFKNNYIKYIFLIASVLLIFTLNFLAVPLIIILYIILSVFKKKILLNN
ncbi:CDP-alcohol phosphatidyltransferase family protein [Polaribacter glomeratus]|uniref:Phosphatidylserine synthase n=1 Tax=Polaribacter glomeratus TaxID=102 RepID=A0A2S7WVK7_9FLAO|nr:CDP-alcohol phosphatidyltransferase family protein [Polaribacter glomeratus]PQJ81625.1 phosphatidylserine synthase [Polaribacter glomeratus]TXD66450.1 phosphatidylserine synthase [Polaribacter glomeratus]